MRTLNVRLAVILLAIIVVVLAPASYFLHRFQQISNADFFLEQANIAKQEAENAKKGEKNDEELKAIEKQCRNMELYLVLRPDNLDVMNDLGILRADHIVDTRSFGQAYGWLDKVIREDETRKEARRKTYRLGYSLAAL